MVMGLLPYHSAGPHKYCFLGLTQTQIECSEALIVAQCSVICCSLCVLLEDGVHCLHKILLHSAVAVHHSRNSMSQRLGLLACIAYIAVIVSVTAARGVCKRKVESFIVHVWTSSPYHKLW